MGGVATGSGVPQKVPSQPREGEAAMMASVSHVVSQKDPLGPSVGGASAKAAPGSQAEASHATAATLEAPGDGVGPMAGAEIRRLGAATPPAPKRCALLEVCCGSARLAQTFERRGLGSIGVDSAHNRQRPRTGVVEVDMSSAGAAERVIALAEWSRGA